jgi:hypothetical protein
MRRVVIWLYGDVSGEDLILKMEAACSSETLMYNQMTTLRTNPEDY